MIARYLNPWKHKREEEQRCIAMLRSRDGDTCSRCRRPLRFDLPAGHDAGAKVEPLQSSGERGGIDNLCLIHGRCNVAGADHTGEVSERIRCRSEAALLTRSRRKPKRAA